MSKSDVLKDDIWKRHIHIHRLSYQFIISGVYDVNDVQARPNATSPPMLSIFKAMDFSVLSRLKMQ